MDRALPQIRPSIPTLQPAEPRFKFRCQNEELIRSNMQGIAGIINAVKSQYTKENNNIATTATYDYKGNTSFAMVGGNLEARPDGQKDDYPGLIIALYSVVFILAAVGNILVLVTLISNRRMRTVTNCFLISLSLSDLLQALVCMPISLIGQILKRFVFGSVMCKVLPYFMGISVSVSTFTLLALAIERYNAICNPLKSRGWQTKSHAYKVIAIIWTISFLIMSPFLVFSKLRYMPLVKQGKCTLACRLYFGGEQARQAWYVLQIVFLFCIPGLVMTVAYTCVCLKISEGFQFETKEKKPKKSFPMNMNICMRRVRGESNGNRNVSKTEEDCGKKTQPLLIVQSDDGTNRLQVPDKSSNGRQLSVRKSNRKRCDSRSLQTESQLLAKKRIVKMLIVIVVLFFVCWTPLFIVNVWKAFDPKGARKIFSGVIEIIQLMSYISTCVNPVTYCFMNKRFREGFLKAFICCLPSRCAAAVENQPTHANMLVLSENSQSTYLTSTPRNQRRSSNRSSIKSNKNDDQQTAQKGA
uniref:Putative cionin receptor n=1 Tax=Ciona intestinalis TaxID=7719 RepID=Q70SX9_CIOIN|nr:putative cionin receptor [Ciona intestinalis]